MVKYTVKYDDSRLSVKAKLSSDEEVCTRELGVFSRKMVRGFLAPKQVKERVIEYTGPAGISLFERLKKPLSKHDFYFIMVQILDVTKKIQENNLFLNKVVFDLRYVFINEKTKELQFVYMPIVTNQVCVDVIGFMQSIVYMCVPDTADSQYISKYIYFIKGLETFDRVKIEKFIAHEEKTVLSARDQGGQSGFITDKPKDYYEHYSHTNDDDDDEATGLLNEDEDDEATGLLNEDEDDEATGLLNEDGDEEATGLLNEDGDDEATGLLNEEPQTDKRSACFDDEEEGTASLGVFERPAGNHPPYHCPTLCRVFTDETIRVDKPVYRIGKERSYVDYFVANNNAVSRSHADIVTRNGRYYVTDLNSKNRTFINNCPLVPQQETEIQDGDELRLANEKFVFHS